MKKKNSVVAIFLVIGISFLFFSTGGKIASVMLTDYSISEDGNVMTLKVGVVSSMGYIRALRIKQGGDNKYITFYSTYGLNSSIGAKNEFEIELNLSCEEIYFYKGDGGYKLILQKNDKTNEWQLVRGQSD